MKSDMTIKIEKTKNPTLRELEEKGLKEPYLHLNDGNYIGGLTVPKSKEYWKSLPFVKIKL